ncbi:MAG: calcium-binding protein [Gemmataceae bacterium]
MSSGNKNRRAKLSLESLEHRLVLSSSVNASGDLVLVGNNLNNNVVVSQVAGGYRVREAGLPDKVYTSAQVRGGDVYFHGYGGNDYFRNDTALRSWAYGMDGNDTLIGGSSADRLEGGNGNDHLQGRQGNDGLDGQGDSDTVFGGDGNDWIYGGAGDDHLDGQGDDDVIFAGDGNDKLYGGAGDDHLDGQGGNDWAFGDVGNDKLYGGTGNDQLYGGRGNDWFFGDDGDDLLDGQQDNDTVYGGRGNDTLFGLGGDDFLDGQQDNDTIFGGEGNDTLFGLGGNDKLYGEAGSDRLDGGEGNDGLFGGIGWTDVLIGGGGADRLLQFAREDNLVDLDRGAGDAVITFTNGTARPSEGVMWSSASWTDAEIQQVDRAFAVLHERTGNTRLLKTAARGDLTFERLGSPANASSVGGWNEGTNIVLINASFSNPNYLVETVFHEIGHNWDDTGENGAIGDFRGLSGWQRHDNGGGSRFPPDGYRLSGDGQWDYRANAAFPRDYGRKSPLEDFADSFAAYFMRRAGLPAEANPANAPAKVTWVDNFLNTVV